MFKLNKYFDIILFISFISFYSSFANTYYVSPSGSSTNFGTLESPWDLSTGFNTVAAGDTLFILPGTYNTTGVSVANHGTANNRIVIMGYDSLNKPVINNTGTDITVRVKKSYVTLKNVKIVNTTSNNYALYIGTNNPAELALFITIDGVEVSTTGVNAVMHGDNCYGAIIRNSVFEGSTQGNGIDIYTRTAQLSDTLVYFYRANNLLIENNIIRNCPNHHAINIFNSPYFKFSPDIDSAIIRNNYAKNCDYFLFVRYVKYYQIYNNIADSVSGFLTYNNAINVDTSITRTDIVNSYSIIANNTARITRAPYQFAVFNTNANYLTVKNNAFFGNFQGGNHIVTFTDSYHPGFQGYPVIGHDINNNLYLSYTGNYLWTWANISSGSFTTWQNASNGDSNSMVGIDPLVDPTTFVPQSNSPLINAGADMSAYYTTDYYGRPRSLEFDIGAVENSIDLVPPVVLSAELVDSITLNITFSEQLNQSSAVNPVNYQIDNGISVNSAQLLGNTVRLQTSVHSPGFYNVLVNNVSDIAGNLISPQNNSASYGYNPGPTLFVIKLLPIGSKASSIPEPDHTPEKTFDGLGYYSGDPSSRWAAQGLPQWIVYDLGDIKMVSKTKIQFFRWLEGRVYTYDILVSTDSVNWVPVKENIVSRGVEWNEENFDPTPGRYVKIFVTGNNENDWANIWETEVYGSLMVSTNEDDESLPIEFKLFQNYPNPFNPTTKIRFVIPKEVRNLKDFQSQAPRKDNVLVKLKVYDILGNEVATLVDENKAPGIYEVEFDASKIASGVYIYRLQADEFVSSKKMILLQ